jgi:hypothetical protein
VALATRYGPTLEAEPRDAPRALVLLRHGGRRLHRKPEPAPTHRYWDAQHLVRSGSPPPALHSQWRSGHRLCGVPGDVSPSVHVCAECDADVIGGRRRRMDLRPYGLEENGGSLEVADHPRLPCRRQPERPAVACSSTSGVALVQPRNGPPALDRPWVPVRRLIPVGSSHPCPNRLGSRHVGSRPTTRNQRTGESDWGASNSKTGNDRSIRFDRKAQAASLTVDTALAAELGYALPER